MTGSPFINSITPLYGSIYGGTLITITGNGFSSLTTLNFGSLYDSNTCTNKLSSIKLDQFSCITPKSNSQPQSTFIIKFVFKIKNAIFVIFSNKI